MKEYKVWISIEEIDEDHDHWENIGEPTSLGTFTALKEAEEFLNQVYCREALPVKEIRR